MDDLENTESSVDIHHDFNASDEFHEFQCSTCKKEGKDMGAEMFCVECDHFLCKTCLKQHNKFGGLKSHQMTKVDGNHGTLGKGNDKSLELPSQRCEVHHGKPIDMYCKNHDEVCCGACAAISHSSCIDMVYIPMAAKEVDVMKETTDILMKIEKVKDHAKNIAQEKLHLSANLKEEKSTLYGQIKDRCDKIINHFKTLETDLLSKLEEKVNEVEEDLKSDLKGSDNVISTLEEENRLLSKHIAGDKISSLFVQLKLAEKLTQKCVDTLKHMKGSTENIIELSLNRKAINIIDDIESLGNIVRNKTIKSIRLGVEFDVRGRTDKSTCDITDIVQHNDDTLYISDFENRTLKRLDNQYRVIDCLSLPGQPTALCFVCSSSLAIALTDTKLVQFASLAEKMKLTTSFSVREHCRGIAHVKGKIYVTCGGKRKYSEGKGTLCVYSLLGQILYVLEVDLSLPKHIQKFGDGGMYIVDKHKGLVILNDRGLRQQRRVFKDIVNLTGICPGLTNQLFICCYNSNKIVLVSENGCKICTLDVDGIIKPQALCFDNQRSRLFVGMDSSNVIKVFELVFE